MSLGKFKAAYKGQMELYLQWLQKNETEPHEETPLGLILCAEGNKEQEQASLKCRMHLGNGVSRATGHYGKNAAE